MGRIISSFHATMSLNRAFENFDHIITALFAAIAVYQFFYGQHMRVVLAVVATTYPFPPPLMRFSHKSCHLIGNISILASCTASLTFHLKGRSGISNSVVKQSDRRTLKLKNFGANVCMHAVPHSSFSYSIQCFHERAKMQKLLNMEERLKRISTWFMGLLLNLGAQASSSIPKRPSA